LATFASAVFGPRSDALLEGADFLATEFFEDLGGTVWERLTSGGERDVVDGGRDEDERVRAAAGMGGTGTGTGTGTGVGVGFLGAGPSFVGWRLLESRDRLREAGWERTAESGDTLLGGDFEGGDLDGVRPLLREVGVAGVFVEGFDLAVVFVLAVLLGGVFSFEPLSLSDYIDTINSVQFEIERGDDTFHGAYGSTNFITSSTEAIGLTV
jgi:hypothetical protein